MAMVNYSCHILCARELVCWEIEMLKINHPTCPARVRGLRRNSTSRSTGPPRVPNLESAAESAREAVAVALFVPIWSFSGHTEIQAPDAKVFLSSHFRSLSSIWPLSRTRRSWRRSRRQRRRWHLIFAAERFARAVKADFGRDGG